MATLTVNSLDYIRPHRNTCRILAFPEDASQTFKKGDPLIFSATAGNESRVKISGADPAGIVGFAAHNASGVTDAEVLLWMADDDAEFIGRVQDAGAVDQLNIAAAGYGIVYDATNLIWRVDLSETTAKVVKVVRLFDPDADVNGRVIFHVLAAARLTYAA